MNNLKKIVLALTCMACLSGYLNAQHKKVLNYQIVDQKRLHFGFTIGLNSMDFTFNRNNYYDSALILDLITPGPGFNVNIVSELRLNEDFALRLLPGLVFGQRGVQVSDNSVKGKNLGVLQIESNYIDVPILLKYSAQRINNFRPYIVAGGSTRYDMAAKKENMIKIKDNQGTVRDFQMNLKPFDYYAEIGVGFDFYLRYFKFSTELKLSKGIRQVLQTNMSTDGLYNISSNVLLLNFHFE